MQNYKSFLVTSLVFALTCPSAGHAQSQQPHLSCKIGPISRTYAAENWLLYSCDDGLSIAFTAPQGNPAFPQYFVITPEDGHYHLIGKGTGDMDASTAAAKEIQNLSKQDVTALIAATKAPKPTPATP